MKSYTECPFYGTRRIAAQLAAEGRPLNRKTVARYMTELGLTALYPGPNLSKRAAGHAVYPYLLRDLAIVRPKWFPVPRAGSEAGRGNSHGILAL